MSLFAVSSDSGATLVRCPPQLDSKATAEFLKLAEPWMKKPETVYVFDFINVKQLDSAIFRAFVLFFQALKNAGSSLYSINVSAAVFEVIRANGLDGVLSSRNSLNEALESAGIRTNKPLIDVEFLNPFIKATLVTLQTQANFPCRIGKLHLKNNTSNQSVEIAGVISLVSNAFHGSIALCFSANVFLALYSSMLGEKHETITKDLEDAAGEILNIIFGQAKAELNAKSGYQIEKAIPTIVRGNQLEIHHLTRNVAVILPFETDHGSFHIEVSTERV